jgi:hypothetical protein
MPVAEGAHSLKAVSRSGRNERNLKCS